MLSFYDHRSSGYGSRGDDRGYRVLPETTLEEHMDPNFKIESFYWVRESEVLARLQQKAWKRNWLLGFRDITSATNERTFIATIFPIVGVGNNLPILMPSDLVMPKVIGLVANLHSVVFDYFVRHKVGGTHLNFFIVEQLPVHPPVFYTEARLAFITPKVLELATPRTPSPPSPATSATTACPSHGTKAAAPLCAPISTPFTLAPTA